jgi:IS5 family transposase
MRGEPGFFDIDERLKELSAKSDDLERLNAIVDFEIFRTDLEGAVPRADRAKGGRPPYDHVLMFKVLILQSSHSLSDERTEYLIKDRLSFMRFLGLSLAQSVPDANSIWNFREALTRATIEDRPAIEVLFKRFDAALTKAGFLAMGGQIIDATIVAAPKQRNTEAEKKDIKAGRIPEDWEPRQTTPEGSRRALDRQILESQAVGGRGKAHRSGDPRFRLQEPYRHRPRPRPDPNLDRHRRVTP